MPYGIDNIRFNFQRKSTRDLLTRRELSLGFKKAWDLIDENFRKKNYIACYFLSYSVFEDRLNSAYKVCLWYSRSKKFSDSEEPTFNDIENESNPNKIITLFEANLITEGLKNDLLKVNKERNNRFHSSIWKLEKFTADSISNVITGTRELDSVRRKQKKTMGK